MIDKKPNTEMKIYRTRVSYKRGYTGQRGYFTEYSFYMNGSEEKTGTSQRFSSVKSFRKRISEDYDVKESDIEIIKRVNTRNK